MNTLPKSSQVLPELENMADAMREAVGNLCKAIRAAKSCGQDTATLDACFEILLPEFRRVSVESRALNIAADRRHRGIKPLVDKASHVLFKITREIERAKNHVASKQSVWQWQYEKFRKGGIPEEKILLIHPPIPVHEIEEICLRERELWAEREAIGRFIAGAPAFDTTVLHGTRLEADALALEAALAMQDAA